MLHSDLKAYNLVIQALIITETEKALTLSETDYAFARNGYAPHGYEEKGNKDLPPATFSLHYELLRSCTNETAAEILYLSF